MCENCGCSSDENKVSFRVPDEKDNTGKHGSTWHIHDQSGDHSHQGHGHSGGQSNQGHGHSGGHSHQGHGDSGDHSHYGDDHPDSAHQDHEQEFDPKHDHDRKINVERQ